MCCYVLDIKKSYEQVKELTDKLNAPIPQKSKSTAGSVRYMIHIDSPDKYQYKQSDIEVYGNIDIEQYFKMTATDRYSHIAEMLEFIDDNDITEFKDMLDYARLRRFDDWFKLLCDNSAYAIEKYIKSNRHKGDRPQSKKDAVARKRKNTRPSHGCFFSSFKPSESRLKRTR